MSKATPQSQEDTKQERAEVMAEFLRGELEDTSGDLYLKSRRVADSLDMSAKEIGHMWGVVDDIADDLTITKWTQSSAATYRITAD